MIASLAIVLSAFLTAWADPPALSVPSSTDLFMEGTFQIRKNPLRFLDENHYGEPLDLSERRPVVDVGQTVFGAKYGRPGSQLVANFFYNGRFYLARVPDRGVRNTYFQLSYFPPQVAGQYVAAHSLLRFEMEQQAPVELVAPMPTPEELAALAAAPEDQRLARLPAEQVTPIHNVAISAEAQWTQNDPHKEYNLVRGTRGAFTQIVRMMAISDRMEEAYGSGNPVDQIRLPLCAGQGDQVLRESMRTSQSDGISRLYDTFWFNCTTLVFDILERTGLVSDSRLGFMRNFMQRRIPILSPGLLAEYGGIRVAPMSQDPSLAQESAEAFRRLNLTDPSNPCTPEMSAENCRVVTEMVNTFVTAATSAAGSSECQAQAILDNSITELAQRMQEIDRIPGDPACPEATTPR
jgi:hypothetical protein